MDDDNQIHVPPSFMAVYTNARGRLTERADTVRTRYELCEDLAGHLVEHAQTLYHVQAPSESEILSRIHAGLCTAESGVSVAEATWIVTRLAELLAWQCPALVAPQPEPTDDAPQPSPAG
ncbi:MAG: hypothetical protein KKB95_06340 [Gammaproteobacteria bacterium]|jgi:hypothetical protein|nr:hypothetical protein [Gammaproteobacteria bacterium]MBU0829833.1 hypothetical protein [Gammaproteobacteria bacterium]MBU0891518.1 hypothetical protein [Gammaproteobacteria bacterium]MBU1351495.1 hypothetical protein [Gammaproteobacteria bacterium]MBU1816338.1 hypothetical protein [Gammaproteobacteria bacterium]